MRPLRQDLSVTETRPSWLSSFMFRLESTPACDSTQACESTMDDDDDADAARCASRVVSQLCTHIIWCNYYCTYLQSLDTRAFAVGGTWGLRTLVPKSAPLLTAKANLFPSLARNALRCLFLLIHSLSDFFLENLPAGYLDILQIVGPAITIGEQCCAWRNSILFAM